MPKKGFLARDYDVPKRPTFLLEDFHLVQSTETAAYVPNSVSDSVMFGTNGKLGIRYRSDVETVCLSSSVFMNGVYHNAPSEIYLKNDSVPEHIQVGATVCQFNVDCLVDGESGTLSTLPSRRLGFRDATFTTFCSDVMSADGGLIFDVLYKRVMSSTDLSLWGAEVLYNRFRLENKIMEKANDSDDARWTNQYYSKTNQADNTYQVEFVVTLAIDLSEWEVVKADAMNDVWQRSNSSGIVVHTSASVSCSVEFPGSGSVSCMTPENEIISTSAFQSGIAGSRTGSSRSLDHYTGYMSDNESELSHFPIKGMASSSLGKNSANRETKLFLIKKRFTLNVKKDSIPNCVTFTVQSRHVADSTAPISPFPRISSIMEGRCRSLEKCWRTFDVELQLQEELVRNRTSLALTYNAFRLFEIGNCLSNGLPKSGCSSTGANLQCELRHYIYHGIFLIFHSPDQALELLRSLSRMLPQARCNAVAISLRKGALFPQSTIIGTECRKCMMAHDVRFHVNAEIGYLIYLYFEAVGSVSVEDRLMLLELFLETARVWPQVGEWVESKTRFRLDNLAGADDYNIFGSGNFYIHLSAKEHLARAHELVKSHLELIGDEKMHSLLQKLTMSQDEVFSFLEISQAIAIPQKNAAGVYMVNDHFDSLAEWKGEKPKHPLSLHYSPLVIYRHKLVDVPDVLLGMLLYPHYFNESDFLQNLSYYEPLCTHDSPESLSILAIMECRARQNFAQPIPCIRALAHLDLENLTYSAEDGLNFVAMSASLNSITSGIGGVSLVNHTLYMNPILPAGIDRVSFTLSWRGAVLKTQIITDQIVYELLSGDSLRFFHGRDMQRIHLHTGFRSFTASTTISIPRLGSNKCGLFDGAICFMECIFDNILEYSFQAWHRTLEALFTNYRTLHHRHIPPISPEEFIEKVLYQDEENGISFSGIHRVLLARGIDLDLGTPDDAEIVETRYGLANAKISEMSELLAQKPPSIRPHIKALLTDLAANGVYLALVTYSRSLKTLLQNYPEETSLFVACIHGEEAHDHHVKGRPHTDLFTRAAQKIHVDPSRCIVFASRLDRGYNPSSLAKFGMFLDLEDPFVSSRLKPAPYPVLQKSEAEKRRGDNRLIIYLLQSKMPRTLEELEDVIYERDNHTKLIKDDKNIHASS